jgi:pyruvate-ferredoxin/flavodoxin oxidoreductase
MVPLHDFLDLDADDREGKFPFVWGVDGKNRLMRALVSQEIVLSCEERRSFWRQLRGLVGLDHQFDEETVRNQAKAEMAQNLTASLLSLAMGGASAGVLADFAPSQGGKGTGMAAAGPAASAGWEPVWIESPECTACDECMNINSKMFAYNGQKQAIVLDPKAGPYKDIVKAAEKCTASCIHPGTPFNPAEKDLDRLVTRAAKYQ